MSVFRVTVGSVTSYRRSTDARLRSEMWAYILAQRAAGVPLADIRFAWCRVL